MRLGQTWPGSGLGALPALGPLSLRGLSQLGCSWLCADPGCAGVQMLPGPHVNGKGGRHFRFPVWTRLWVPLSSPGLWQSQLLVHAQPSRDGLAFPALMVAGFSDSVIWEFGVAQAPALEGSREPLSRPSANTPTPARCLCPVSSVTEGLGWHVGGVSHPFPWFLP